MRKGSVNRIRQSRSATSSNVSSRETTSDIVPSPRPSVSAVETTSRCGGEGKVEQRSRPKAFTKRDVAAGGVSNHVLAQRQPHDIRDLQHPDLLFVPILLRAAGQRYGNR